MPPMMGNALAGQPKLVIIEKKDTRFFLPLYNLGGACIAYM